MDNKNKLLSVFLIGTTLAILVFVIVMHNYDVSSELSQNHSESSNHNNHELSNEAAGLNIGDDPLEKRISSLENSLETMTKQLTNLNDAIKTLADQNNITASMTNTISDKIERTPEDISQLKAAREQILQERVDPSISFDPQWTPYVEENVRAAFTTNKGLALAESSSVQCGATACKVSATLPASMPTTQREIYTLAMMIGLGKDLPHASSSKSVRQSDGSYQVSLYMGHPDHPLPDAIDD